MEKEQSFSVSDERWILFIHRSEDSKTPQLAEKSNWLRSCVKRQKPERKENDDELMFISASEEANILQNEVTSKRKRSKPAIEKPIVEETDSHPEWKKGKKDVREISTVLPLAEIIKSKGYNVKGPIITPMMVEYFHEYLQKNPKIQRIAVLGFNSGMIV